MFVSTMLKRVSERGGHRAAVYTLLADGAMVYSAGADGLIVEWHRGDEDFGRAVAQGKGKWLSLLRWEDHFIAGGLDGSVHWLFPGDPTANRHLSHHRRGTFALLRIGPYLYSAGGDGVLTRWDPATRRPLESRRLSSNSLRCLAFNPYRNQLAVGASDGMLYLLHPTSFETLCPPAPAAPPSVFTVAFHPDGDHLYTGGRDARLGCWPLTENGLGDPAFVAAHQSTVNAVALHPRGRLLATASRDKTVKLWDVGSLELLKVCEPVRDRGHVNSVNCLVWADERTLFTAGDDRRILEWSLSSAP